MVLSLFESILGNPAANSDLKLNTNLISFKSTSGFDTYAARAASLIYKKNTDENTSYIEIREIHQSSIATNENVSRIAIAFIEQVQTIV